MRKIVNFMVLLDGCCLLVLPCACQLAFTCLVFLHLELLTIALCVLFAVRFYSFIVCI